MSRLHALVVDDNALNNDVLVTLLESAGVAATALESPKNLTMALNQINDLAIIFLDLEFPQHDGFNLLKELRGDPALQDIPIVAYTVHTSEIDEARKAGFDSFLGKPLDIRRFPEQLRKILNKQPVWDI